MKNAYLNAVSGVIALSMVMGMTSCEKSVTETTEVSSDTAAEASAEPSSTATATPNSEASESELSGEVSLYVDWDNYYSGKADKNYLMESKYNRLTPELIDHYEAGTSDGYVYAFCPNGIGEGSDYGLVDESGTIVCDSVYDSLYPADAIQINHISPAAGFADYEYHCDYWIARKDSVDGVDEYGNPNFSSKYSLISFDGTVVLDNNGEGYDRYFIAEDYIYCDAQENGLIHVNVYNPHGELLIDSEFNSPVRALNEEYAESEIYDSYYIDSYFFISLLNNHYSIYRSVYDIYFTLDLLSGEVVNVETDTDDESVWYERCTQGYIVRQTDYEDGVSTMKTYDIFGNLHAVMEECGIIEQIGSNVFFVGLDNFIDFDGNPVVYDFPIDEEEIESYYTRPIGFVNSDNGHLYSYEGKDMGEPLRENNYDVIEFYGSYYDCEYNEGVLTARRDSDLQIAVPDGITLNRDIMVGTHTVLGRDEDSNTYYMFDIETGEILFVYHLYLDYEVIACGEYKIIMDGSEESEMDY